MKIKFTKMQGLGNDFVVIDATRAPIHLTPTQIQTLADRHFGIGFDQLLMLESAANQNVDFNYRIFNADGGEVAQCGNGARCIARYIHDHGLSKKTEIVVATSTGKLQLRLEKNNQVSVNMGIPEFKPEKIPFIADQQSAHYALQFDAENIEMGAVAIGNPHAVIRVENVDTAPVAQWGPQIEHHQRFPQQVNVGFMQVINPEQIKLRVFERGAGETLACGSGACAAVIIGRLWQLLADKVTVTLLGGTLLIEWQGEGHPVWMTGPAVEVFAGEVELEGLGFSNAKLQ